MLRIMSSHERDDDDDDFRSDDSGSSTEEEQDTNLQPDESKQTSDRKNRFKWIEHKEKFQYQFRNVNSSFPADKDAVNEMKSLQMQEMIRDDNTDCSEIAERLYKVSGGKGAIMTIVPKVGHSILVGEKKEGQLHVQLYVYHTVFRDNHYVYGPRLSKNPIPRGDYQSIINKLNINGVRVHEGLSKSTGVVIL